MRRFGGGSLRWDQEEVANDRYPPDAGIVGRDAWVALVEALQSGDDALGAFDSFLDSTAGPRGRTRATRVFISHKSAPVDDRYAERLVELASAVRLPCWLDILNPVLIGLNGRAYTGRLHGILIAATIEMALLNCTHVIVVHSVDSTKSKWIPYEFGRVKVHLPYSLDAAGYFHPDVWNSTAAEYFELAVKAFGEGVGPPSSASDPWVPVTQWLTDAAKRSGGLPRQASPTFPRPRPNCPALP